MPYYRTTPDGRGKAYAAYAIVSPDRLRAYPAGAWMTNDFCWPSIDAPTFYAIAGESLIGCTVERGTITYDGAVDDGRSYFRPHGRGKPIHIPTSTERYATAEIAGPMADSARVMVGSDTVDGMVESDSTDRSTPESSPAADSAIAP